MNKLSLRFKLTISQDSKADTSLIIMRACINSKIIFRDLSKFDDRDISKVRFLDGRNMNNLTTFSKGGH